MDKPPVGLRATASRAADSSGHRSAIFASLTSARHRVAAREAVARKPTGRPPLTNAEYAERQLSKRKRKQSKEVENG